MTITRQSVASIAIGALCEWPPRCAFSKACINPGELWFHPALKRWYCQQHRRLFDGSMAGADGPRDARPGGGVAGARNGTQRYGGTSNRDMVAEPTLLFPRRMIEHALETAAKLAKAKTPAQYEESLEALHWILDRADWKDRCEFFASFDWCAHWWRSCRNPLEVDTLRLHYLRRLDRALARMRRSRLENMRRKAPRSVQLPIPLEAAAVMEAVL